MVESPWGVGPIPASIMLVGEAWGEKEEREGRPFVGVSGEELDRYLSWAEIPRSEVYITNLVNERPPNNSDPTPAMIAAHEGRLAEELLAVRPKYVVTLGRFSTHWFLPSYDPKRLMERECGIGHEIALCEAHGRPDCSRCDDEYDAWMHVCVIPIYHPAYGLYSSDEQPTIERGFEHLREIIDGTRPPHPPVDAHPNPDYFEITNPYDVERYFGQADVVAVDTEGSIRSPWCLSACVEPGYAYVIATSNKPCVEAFAKWMERNDPLVVMHYAAHDLQVLAAMGIAVRRFADTMLIQYLLGPMYSQALKTAAHRELGMDMLSYEELTADVDRALAVAYLEAVLTTGRCPTCRGRGEQVVKLPAHTVPAHTKTVVTKRGPVLRNFKPKYVSTDYRLDKCQACLGDGTRWPRPQPIPLWENGKLSMWQPSPVGARVRRILADVHSGKVNRDGEPTDPRERWEGTDPPEAVADVICELGHMPTATLNMVEPRQRVIDYACRDADATLRLWQLKDPQIDEWGLREIYDTDLAVIPVLVEMQQTGWEVDTAYFAALCREWDAEAAKLRHQLQKLVGYHVNPGSSKQVANLLFEKLRLPPVKLTKSKLGESTDDKVLEQLRMSTAHPVIDLIVRHRELDKLKGTYGEPLSKVDAPDRRVRMEFKYTRTDTGRISSSKPKRGHDRHNWIQGQNIPTRSEEGKRILGGFVAKPGCRIAGFDLSQIEWRVLAHLSQDANLMNVFFAGEDMHYRTAALIYGIPISQVTKDQRQDAKNVGFGMGYRITWRGLVEQFAQRGITLSRAQAEEFIAKYLGAYPGIPKFWEDVETEARRNGYVRSPSGRIRWVSGVRSAAPWVRSEAERQACNFPVQEYAAYIMKRILIEIATRVLPAVRRRFYAAILLTVHDSVFFEVEEGAEDVLGPLVRRVMRDTVRLSVPVSGEGKVGTTWLEAK